MTLSLKLRPKVIPTLALFRGKNDARNSKRESQIKAKLKTLTKPSNLTEGFRNNFTDYSTRSATAINIL